MTKAFLGLGTSVKINGTKIAETRSITLGKRVCVAANYVPCDAGQIAVRQAIESEWPVEIAIENQAGYVERFEQAVLVGFVKVSPGSVVTIWFTFDAAASRRASTTIEKAISA